MLAQGNSSEEALLFRLRSGDASAFAGLVDTLHPRLLEFARTFTWSRDLAEDIAQETWLGVIRGLKNFQGRSSLRTWIFSILVRRARTMTARQARRWEVPMPGEESRTDGPSAEWEPGRGRVGLWDERLVPWGLEDPASVFQRAEALAVIRQALNALPARQRQVVLLRDVEDVAAEDVCNILAITGTNLRVLLHRGRARVRRALDCYVRGDVERLGRTGDAASSVASPPHPRA